MTTAFLPALAPGARLLLYAHDTYGLGHLRRSLAIASHLAHALPGLSTLLVTGSPVAHHFALPPNTDYVKLPAVVKMGDEQYRARDLALTPERVTNLRAAIIREAGAHFEPDVVLVDHAPLGMKGELLPALRSLRRERPATRLMLGLRDVLDEPQKVRHQWSEQGVYAAIEELYDRVLVYGQADLFDPVRAYAFPATLAARTHFCGYIRRKDPVRSLADLRAELDLGEDPFVLATTGGGGDGVVLEETFLGALDHLDRRRALQAVIITGPLMAAAEHARLQERAQGRPVRLLPFHPDAPRTDARQRPRRGDGWLQHAVRGRRRRAPRHHCAARAPPSGAAHPCPGLRGARPGRDGPGRRGHAPAPGRDRRARSGATVAARHAGPLGWRRPVTYRCPHRRRAAPPRPAERARRD